MVQRSKCDVCRARKLKCDESRPSCRVCQKGNRVCTYIVSDRSWVHVENLLNHGRKYSKSSDKKNQASVLTLRSIQRAKSGSFQVLKSHYARHSKHGFEHGSLRPSLTGLGANLISRWSQLQVDIPSYAYKLVPSMIGNTKVLDSAVEYMLVSHHAFRTSSEDEANTALQIANATALKMLRGALAVTKGHPSDDILLSMLVLRMTEFLRGLQTFRFLFHSLALGQILQARWRSGRWREFDQRLLHVITVEEAQDAILAGNPCLLDDPLLFRARTLSHATVNFTPAELIYDDVLSLVLRAPRVLCQVRHAIAEGDRRLLDIAWQLLSAAVNDPNCDRITKAIQKSIIVHAAKDRPFEANFEYGSNQELNSATLFSMCRGSLFGAYLRLAEHDRFGVPSPSELEAVQMEDVRLAEVTVSSIDFAIHQSMPPNIPWPAQKMTTPIAVAFGAFKRLEKRCGQSGTQVSRERQAYARSIKQYLTDSCFRTFRIWHQSGWHVPLIIDAVSEAFSAGSPMPWLSPRGRTFDWDAVLTA